MKFVPIRSHGWRPRSTSAALIGVVALLALPAVASANSSNFESGRAYDVGIKSDLLSTLASVGPDTGFISTNQTSSTSQCAASVFTSLVNARVLCASFHSDAATETATSEASVAQVGVTLPGAPAISATLVDAKSTTSCRAGGTSSAGSSVGTLKVGTSTYNLAAPPNTVIPLGPLGSITINEQKPIKNGLMVNAIDIRTIAGTQIIIASASSAVSNCAG